MEIANFNVLEQYQDMGIGNKLLKRVMELSTNKENITLEVKEDNTPAIKLYLKNGFVKTAIREAYYNGVDGILMERKYKDSLK